MDSTANPLSAKRRVGILGGGQLGLMLAQAARSLELSPILFEAQVDSPAAPHCDEVIHTALRRFLSTVEVVSFENEWLDSRPLHEASAGLATQFAPSLTTLEGLRDKLTQKEILARLNISAPPFLALQPEGSVHRFLEEMWKKFGERAVLKWARMGYDGHGVFLADFAQAGEEDAAQVFIQKALDRGIPVYAEERVDFVRELALVSVRSVTGEFAAYPLVISEQRGGICYRVTGPAVLTGGVSPGLELQACEAARLLASDQNIVGAFAIEFFETRTGQLLVNEIAPRVHNSGHFTQDACETSQFVNHWRAALGQALGPTTVRAPFAMLNLLGPEGISTARAAQADAPPLPAPPLYLHWYGKKELRARRKMGHLTAVGTLEGSPAELSGLLKKLDTYREDWVNRLRGVPS